MRTNVVAIDGPSASGKSTVARRVASALGWHYVDSGALYRGVTWKALRKGTDMSNPDDLARLLLNSEVRLYVDGESVKYTLDDVDPGMELRQQAVNDHVSLAAAAPGVRARIVEILRSMTRFGNLVMEGRDIGTVVFPETPFKFYLDASPEERAKRRHHEMKDLQPAAAAEVGEVEHSLRRRDRLDSARSTAPLKIADGACTIDSTSLGIDEVVSAILARIRASVGDKL